MLAAFGMAPLMRASGRAWASASDAYAREADDYCFSRWHDGRPRAPLLARHIAHLQQGRDFELCSIFSPPRAPIFEPFIFLAVSWRQTRYFISLRRYFSLAI